MRVMSKEPGKGWKIAEIENTLEALQRGVGGKLEAVTLASDACVLCNEEGRLLGMPYNTTICGVSFVGPLLIVGIAGEDFAGLTEQQVDRLRTLFPAVRIEREKNADDRNSQKNRCIERMKNFPENDSFSLPLQLPLDQMTAEESDSETEQRRQKRHADRPDQFILLNGKPAVDLLFS